MKALRHWKMSSVLLLSKTRFFTRTSKHFSFYVEAVESISCIWSQSIDLTNTFNFEQVQIENIWKLTL